MTDQKQIHLAQTLPFQKDSGMDQQLSIQSSSQAKSRGDENRDSNDNSSEHEETATRTTKQVYPWMTEFRTKGTKQYLIRFRNIVFESVSHILLSNSWAWI